MGYVMAKELRTGKSMAPFMLADGRMVPRTEMESTKRLRLESIPEAGPGTQSMAKDIESGLVMGTTTADGKWARKMATEFVTGLITEATLAGGKMISSTGLAPGLGPIGKNTWEAGR